MSAIRKGHAGGSRWWTGPGLALAGVAMIAVGACQPAAAKGPPSPTGAPPAAAVPNRAQVNELVALVNKRRRAQGCAALIWDESAALVAQRHSEDMARRGYFSHRSADGRDPAARLRGGGIAYRAAAENIAEGQTSGRQVFDGWIGSRDHRANIEDCRYTHHGVGLYQNRWTHVFVRYEQ